MDEIHFIKENKLDLALLARAIWIRKSVILKSVFYSLIIGLIIAFGSKKEYSSSIKLISNSNEGIKTSLGGLSSLAGLAGINLNAPSENIINPEIYPQITGSIPYLLEILNEDIYFSSMDTTVSTIDYFKYLYRPSLMEILRKYTIGLPNTIRSALNLSEKSQIHAVEGYGNIIRLSKEDTKIIEMFEDRIVTSYDDESGIINISIIMPDQNAVAELTQFAFLLLQRYLIEFKTENAKGNLEFIEARYEESKNHYEELQKQLAIYTDQNQNVKLARVQIEQQNIQNEYDLAFEIYKGLATQLEQAKLKVKENTPVLTVIDPAIVPIEKSKPARLSILIIFLFLGAIVGMSLIIFNKQITSFMRSVKK